ncbi:MAG: hypothetical protein IPM37_02960 [Hahellaceae bacterium]|nr:hypothetical protein [Hahellaceae bacterium]
MTTVNNVVMDVIGEQRSLSDYLAIFKRRQKVFWVPAIAIFMLVLIVAVMLPAKYQSIATILIEEQEVPRDFVRSTITNYADQQIQIINRRLMTVDTISKMAEKFTLYRDDAGDALPSTELVKRFAEDMSMGLVSADVVDPRSGRPAEATIAFTLSFIHENPSTSQKVTNELVTLFLNENLRTRADKAQSTESFLAEEARLLQVELQELEQKLAEFKQANEGSLPELYQFNLSVVERTERELTELSYRLQELGKRELDLAAELSQVSPSATIVTPGGEAIMSDSDRLKFLESEFRRLTAVYQEAHPDVIAVKREIAELRAKAERGESRQAATNPAYVLLQTQLSSVGLEKRTLLAKQQELDSRKRHYESLIQKAPLVEKDYQALLRDHGNASQKYQDLKVKQREAQLAKNMEQERKGERFSLVEPPSLPISPVKPNRMAIVVFGFILATGIGLGLAFLKEASDSGLYGERALEKVLGAPVLGVVPYLSTSEDQMRATHRLRKQLVALFGSVLLFVVMFHLLVKPLDVLYFMILQRLGMG